MPSSTPYDCGDRARTSSRRRSPLCTSKGADTGVTDWPQIAHVYGVLAGMDPSPVVALNHAAAVGFAAGPELGPEMLAPCSASGHWIGTSRCTRRTPTCSGGQATRRVPPRPTDGRSP